MIGPKGPFAPCEWHEKVFPGCKVELQRESTIGYPLQKPQMLHLPASPRENDKSSLRSESSARTAIPLPRPASPHLSCRGKKREVKRLENLPPESHGDRQSIRSKTCDHSIDGRTNPNSVVAVSAGQPSDSTSDEASYLASKFDETDHLKTELGSNADVQVDIEEGEYVPQKLRRKNTDMQSFVEDDTEADDYPSAATGDSSLPSDLLVQVCAEISGEGTLTTEDELDSSVAIDHSSLPQHPMEVVDSEISEEEIFTPEIELESSVSTAFSKQGKREGVLLL